MSRIILLIVVIGIIGLAAGYLIFARQGDRYLSLKALLSPSKNVFDDLVKSVRGIPQIRRNILICGGAGAAAGLVLGVATGGSRRRTRRR